MKNVFGMLLFSLILTFSSRSTCAQCSNAGFKNGSSFVNDNTIAGYSFGSLSNVSALDGNVASASATLSVLSGNTQYLEATGFGFAIPSNSSICGIVVEVEKNATGINVLSSIKDNSVRLIKGGTYIGSNRAKGANWTGTLSSFTYGANNDLWGTTWTPANINAANFGIGFSAELNGILALLPSARIDNIRINVYFNIVLPINITAFTTKASSNHTALLQWSAASNDENAIINIERKTASEDWKKIHSLRTGIFSEDKQFTYTDTSCHEPNAYYRLQIQHTSGNQSYSKVNTVQWLSSMITLYPNPAKNEINVDHPINTAFIYCTGTDGRRWNLQNIQPGTPHSKIDIQHLPPGTYILTVGDKKGMFVKSQ